MPICDAIQERRMLAVRFTQWLQLTAQKQVVSRVLTSEQRPKPPLIFKLLEDFSGAAAHPGAPARRRHPPRAYSHAGGGAARTSSV